MPPAAEYFVGTVNDELVCHVAIAPFFTANAYRATRLVVMPEWQGAGVGTKFLEWVCEYHKQGLGRCGRKLPTMFHTSHPQLIGYLKNSPKWVLKSQQLYGGNKVKSMHPIKIANAKKLLKGTEVSEIRESFGSKSNTAGYGGHFRAVQGFKYIGERPWKLA